MLNKLGAEIVKVNEANGWDVLRPGDWGNALKIAASLALIHSEVSEALEALRTGDAEHFREELADVIIRVLDCGIGLNFDLDDAVAKKLDKNRTRGFRHGGKAI